MIVSLIERKIRIMATEKIEKLPILPLTLQKFEDAADLRRRG